MRSLARQDKNHTLIQTHTLMWSMEVGSLSKLITNQFSNTIPRGSNGALKACRGYEQPHSSSMLYVEPPLMPAETKKISTWLDNVQNRFSAD